jgi:hypothetical protein
MKKITEKITYFFPIIIAIVIAIGGILTSIFLYPAIHNSSEYIVNYAVMSSDVENTARVVDKFTVPYINGNVKYRLVITENPYDETPIYREIETDEFVYHNNTGIVNINAEKRYTMDWATYFVVCVVTIALTFFFAFYLSAFIQAKCFGKDNMVMYA